MMRAHALQPTISGVLYAEDFDEPLPPAIPAEPVPSASSSEPELIGPCFSLDELRAATEEAHEDGREAERRAAALSLATRHSAALSALVEQIAMTQTEAVHRVEQALDAVARTALSLLAAALPALCAVHAQDELRAVLHRVLPPARQLPELRICVHPSLREVIENEAGAVLDGSGTRVSWTNSSKLLPGDIAVSWQNGAALRDTAAICAEIRDAVLALFENGHGTLESGMQDEQ